MTDPETRYTMMEKLHLRW